MSKEKVKGTLVEAKVVTESSDAAREFYNQGRFGELVLDQKVELSLIEAVYLVEKKKLVVTNLRNAEIPMENLIKKAVKAQPSFKTRYAVFKDIRDRGYIIKTALKFGADFRIYERGVKPGEDHAKWIVYPVQESEHLTWYEFAAKNRVAHSTKKRLLIGVVDDESDVSYWEIRWIKP